jgi:hypothetical protein
MRRNGISDDNWVYGPLHIERTLKNWKVLVRTCEVDEQMAKLVMIGAYFHNVGWNNPEGLDYLEASIAFFCRKVAEGLFPELSPEEIETIVYAIRYHDTGLEKMGLVADSRQNIALQYLSLIVWMDAICYVGFYRILGSCGQRGEIFELLSTENTVMLMPLLYGNPTWEQIETLKFEEPPSVLDLLIYDLLVFRRILVPIEHLLSAAFREDTKKRKQRLQGEIEKLIKMERKNEITELEFFEEPLQIVKKRLEVIGEEMERDPRTT